MSDVGTVRIDLTTGTLCLKIDNKNANQTSVKPLIVNPGETGSISFDVTNSCASPETLNMSMNDLPDGISITFTQNNSEITFPFPVSGETTETIEVNVSVSSSIAKGNKYYLYIYFTCLD